MKGLELSEKYYNEYGSAVLDAVGDYAKELCFGLVGSGSECYGFDDDVSKDHDFEPGFCIFVPDDIDSKTEFTLERAYLKLPKSFMGYKRLLIAPAGGARHGVIRIGDFYRSKTGFPGSIPTEQDWLRIPDGFLAEAVNGKIFRDSRGEFSAIRSTLKNIPADVLKKRLAGHAILTAQSGQYNYARCLAHGETAAAQLALFEFVNHAMNIVFLLNNEYMPFYKWRFRAIRNLKTLGSLADSFEFLLTSENDKKTALTKQEVVDDIISLIIGEFRSAGISDATCSDLAKHGTSINDGIRSPSIRNLDILYCV